MPPGMRKSAESRLREGARSLGELAAFARRGFLGTRVPLHLTLFVTGRCNLRCRHCFHWRAVAQGRAGPRIDEIERLAASLREPLLWLALGGGEPFLRDDLERIAGAFARGGLWHLSIPTNGLLADPVARVDAILDACPGTHVSIGVSIDGPAPVHDRLRGAVGCHARAVRTLKALLRRRRGEPRLGVGILTTVTRANQDVLAAHVERLVRELGPDNLTINLARKDALDRELLDVDVERYEDVVRAKRRLVEDGCLPYFDFPFARLGAARDELLYERIASIARGEPREHLPCTAGRLSAVVFEDGELHACEVLGESLGNLRDVDWQLPALWHGSAAEELRRRIRETRCTCTWECAQGDNLLFRLRSWPQLVRRSLSR